MMVNKFLGSTRDQNVIPWSFVLVIIINGNSLQFYNFKDSVEEAKHSISSSYFQYINGFAAVLEEEHAEQLESICAVQFTVFCNYFLQVLVFSIIRIYYTTYYLHDILIWASRGGINFRESANGTSDDSFLGFSWNGKG